KPDGYEVTVEGQTVGFTKTDIKLIVKSPREVLGDADRQVEEAKRLYSDAVVMTDEKAAEARFREALPKVQKAREAYVEARELFPEGYPELDDQLVTIMKLMRLVRERCHSQIADGGAPSPVKAKTTAPPRPLGRPSRPPSPPSVPAPAQAPAPDPAPPADPPPPAPEPAAEEPPGAENPVVIAPPPTILMKDALEVLVSPAKRSDAKLRREAKAAFRMASEAGTPLSDVATAGWLLLSKSDEEWGLLTDNVTVKGTGGETLYKGDLEKRSDSLSVLFLADRRELRIRTAKDGIYVTPPGAAEFKATQCKIEPNQPSDAFEALQTFFKGLDAAKLESLNDKDVSEGVSFLALKVKEFRSKNVAAEALALFVAGAASALIEKNKGKPTLEIEVAFKDLGFEKSEFGTMWGRKEGLAMDDYRKWLASGEYGMGIVQFTRDYKNVNETPVKYALGLLYLFRALGENRDYQKAAVYLDAAAAGTVPAARDHLAALAKSIRSLAPCNICGGTHKVNCFFCKGKIKVDILCQGCGGSGRINKLVGGVVTCPQCSGRGRFTNVDCPKCKGAGQIECKGRGCAHEVPKPTFESFAEAYQCPSCLGHGSLMRHVAFLCPECSGIGLILQPKADPTKVLR
ncbi:MAG TPA: hypothetical protein VMU54_25010, partial [Planctomycetota bacterium]|nr:hypothetical protein [Planctomycetota bacterium]